MSARQRVEGRGVASWKGEFVEGSGSVATRCGVASHSCCVRRAANSVNGRSRIRVLRAERGQSRPHDLALQLPPPQGPARRRRPQRRLPPPLPPHPQEVTLPLPAASPAFARLLWLLSSTLHSCATVGRCHGDAAPREVPLPEPRDDSAQQTVNYETRASLHVLHEHTHSCFVYTTISPIKITDVCIFVK